MGVPILLLIVSHVVVAGACVPLILRRVAPNRTYGFRTPATLRDARVWYEANAVAGRCVFAAALVSGAAAAIFFSRLPTATALVAAHATFVLCLLVGIALAFVALRRIAR